ncbi:MAG: NAD(P)H-dependent oxidoreductase [Woeseiaceae bacterium]
MIIVDTALKQRESEGRPIQVGIVGAGYMGRGMALTIEKSIPGMRVAAIYNRTPETARQALEQCGVEDIAEAKSAADVEAAVEAGRYVFCDDVGHLCQAGNIDAIVEATGEVEFGAQVTMDAIENGKHVILMNAELDAVIGPILKNYADRAGVVITNVDGDQPGVIMNLFRWVDTIGYQPVLAGNIKGLQDHYRNPETQRGFAEKHRQKPKMITSFADGTKISMEMAVVANATGFGVSVRGMKGPTCTHVTEAIDCFTEDDLTRGGIVDFILGAEPGPGVFVIGYNEEPVLRQYANYLKMGDGPYYTFYVPYHLPHLESPLTVARAVLFNDAAITPKGAPVAEVLAAAKTDVKAGEIIDGIGGFHCYGLVDNVDIARGEDAVPMSLIEGCKLQRDVARDDIISYGDVRFPEGRVCDRLRKEQDRKFFGSKRA